MFAAQVRGGRYSQVEPPTLALTILASFGGLSFDLLQGWPLWVIGGATMVPWLHYSHVVTFFDASRLWRRKTATTWSMSSIVAFGCMTAIIGLLLQHGESVDGSQLMP
jgi:hypothetical protein